MTALARMGTILAGLLIGLGAAVLVRSVREVGFDHFALGYIVGPGLIAAGIARIKLQRMLQPRSDEDPGGDRG